MNVEKILKEISFTAVRSGGPGGQHANKVSSKVVTSIWGIKFFLQASTRKFKSDLLFLMSRCSRGSSIMRKSILAARNLERITRARTSRTVFSPPLRCEKSYCLSLLVILMTPLSSKTTCHLLSGRNVFHNSDICSYMLTSS